MKAFSKLTNKLGKTGLKIKSNSPVIFLVTGTICLGGAVVAAHHAGRKIDEVLDVNKEHIENIKSLKDADEIENEEGEKVPYSKKQYNKDLTHAYAGALWDVSKLYLPVAGFTVASAVCYISGHKVLSERLAAMTAAYTGVNEAFQKYRGNVIEMDGEDKDKKYLYGITEHVDNATVAKVDPETGEIKTEKAKNIDVVRDVKLIASPYAVDMEDCKGFTKDPEYNVRWLENIQNLANAKLDSNGYLFLYDVYEALGVLNYINTDAVKASHVVGWIKGVGDDEVRFQLVPIPVKCKYTDGEIMNIAEKVLIDFNCCGTILDRI